MLFGGLSANSSQIELAKYAALIPSRPASAKNLSETSTVILFIRLNVSTHNRLCQYENQKFLEIAHKRISD
jgi:hypothetical protein